MGLIFVTHDLAVARLVSKRVFVMHAGLFVEQGATEQVFAEPAHPCTLALLAAHPGHARSWRELEPMPDIFAAD